jgi:DNA-binding GntR family transcriptional regulator
MASCSQSFRPSGRADRRRIEIAQRLLGLIQSNGLEEGVHLVEQDLADSLGVSRTPVRSALKLLEAHGAVRSVPNQGFFISRPRCQLRGLELTPPRSAEETLYLRIVEDRLEGHLPERVTQVEMIRRFEVSRTVLQRVLDQMADEGVLKRNPGQGWMFQPSLDSRQALLASFEYRLTLEPAIMSLSTFQCDSGVLVQLRNEHAALLENEAREKVSGMRLFRMDSRFHETLAGFSGNPFFLNAVQQQNRLRRMIEYRGYRNRRRIADWCQEHLAILAALERRHLRKASRLMQAHLMQACHAATTLVP